MGPGGALWSSVLGPGAADGQAPGGADVSCLDGPSWILGCRW